MGGVGGGGWGSILLPVTATPFFFSSLSFFKGLAAIDVFSPENCLPRVVPATIAAPVEPRDDLKAPASRPFGDSPFAACHVFCHRYLERETHEKLSHSQAVEIAMNHKIVLRALETDLYYERISAESS